ncbi:excisionase [Lactococcus chungangensis CAU 28 = DSM 22330]|uniref:Excisionase n=1 Tax=Pseudolactococcus chungangensis CAU 28 = DSM 22330 TaxID=1122154 RepID=A0ABX4I7V8_9LACT|nr:excisionase [Lactococcus chungangensis CAU 28 = DSM 22330]
MGGVIKANTDFGLKVMLEHPEFKKGVLNPTHKIVFINKEVILEFVSWKEETRYKSYKKVIK